MGRIRFRFRLGECLSAGRAELLPETGFGHPLYAGDRATIPDLARSDFAELADALINATQRFAETQAYRPGTYSLRISVTAKFSIRHGLLLRKDCQFHWHNRDYSTFDDFLGELRSSNAKNCAVNAAAYRNPGSRFDILAAAN